MRACASNRHKHVYAIFPSQSGKSNSTFNVIGERVDNAPVPIIYLAPTKTLLIDVLEPKIDQMLRTSESLWSKTVQGKKYTKTRKLVAGVSVRLGWGGHSTQPFKGDQAGMVILDEVDDFDADIGGQGGLVQLSDARHGGYLDGKTIGVSTPTEGNVETYVDPRTGLEHWAVADPEQIPSAIWRLWQGGSRHEWAWPCPDCREFFISRLKLLQWPEGSTPLEAERAARLACPHCGSLIGNEHKRWMNDRGVMLAPGQRPKPFEDGDEHFTVIDHTSGEPIEHTVAFGDYVMPVDVATNDASQWTSGVANYQPTKSFGYLASLFLSAARTGKSESVKGVLNTEFAECFKFGGDAPEWHAVLACAEDYVTGDVPRGVDVLCLTVDVQKDRLEYVIRGWAADEESWLIDYGELYGESHDTSKPDVWAELDEVIAAEYGGLPIRLALVDSGYRRDDAYAFCRRHRGSALPTKGQEAGAAKPLWSSPQDVNYRGRTIRRGVELWNFDTDVFKSWVHARVDWPSDHPGGWHLPRDISEAYCRQIVAEQRLITPAGRIYWKRVGPNEKFDCEVLQVVAMRIFRIKRHGRWERRVTSDGDPRGEEPTRRVVPQRSMVKARDPYL